MSDKILVVGEAKDGELRSVSFEVIAAAKQIKEDAEIVALLLGEEGLDAYANEMIQYGADRAITVSHANLKEYTSEGYGQALLEVINQQSLFYLTFSKLHAVALFRYHPIRGQSFL